MLEELLKKTELKSGDDNKTMVKKAIGLGIIEGLFLVGASTVVTNVLKLKK